MKKKFCRILTMLMSALLMFNEIGAVLPAMAKEPESAGNEEKAIPGNPVSSNGVVSWDCVWFGNYWQEDTNGDEKCVSEDSVIDDVTYPADDKQPIKWRVLSVDDNGEALLLADKNLEARPYNTTSVGVTWETCTLRSFLNGYGADANVCGEDYSKESFIGTAFDAYEKATILNKTLVNPNNPSKGTNGGNDTEDRIFLLAVDEILNEKYGFASYNFSYYDLVSDMDEAKCGYNTSYVALKNSLFGSDYWWLRTPGEDSIAASAVGRDSSVYASGFGITDENFGIRPALRINLLASVSLWKDAGTVCSDGTMNEKSPAGEGDDPGNNDNPGNTDDPGNNDDPGNIDDPGTENNGLLRNPVSSNGVVTWDCVWFGRYWQEDTNGDGECLSENYTDKGFGHITYLQDDKQPIKWRVLSNDKNGNALLLADKIIEIREYDAGYEAITWEKCTLRSFLNSYGSESNLRGEDHSNDGFFTRAFNASEQTAIKNTLVVNSDNPVTGTAGGVNTEDKIFLLSCDEAMNSKYGFISNEFTHPYTDIANRKYNFVTDDDKTRVASSTGYAVSKGGSYGDGSGYDWWLRSPGGHDYEASVVSDKGAVDVSEMFYVVYSKYVGIRPALYINLNDSASVWSYAGTVCSDGTADEKAPDPAETAAAEEEAKKEAEEKAAMEEAAEKEKTVASIPDEQGVVKAFYEDAANSDIVMLPGEFKRLSLTPSDYYIYGVKWTVESASVRNCVKLKDGVVNAVKPGTATVKATYRDTTPLSFKITVVDENSFKAANAKSAEKNYTLKAKKTVKTAVGKSGTKLVLSLPNALKGKTVSVDMLDAKGNVIAQPGADGILIADMCIMSYGMKNPAGTKLTYTLTPKDAGAAYVRFTVSYTDSSGKDAVSQALTKLIITKPVTKIDASVNELNLKPGEGKRIIVSTTADNTVAKAPLFKVKGKGIKVSRSGYVTAAAAGAYGTVTVKFGKALKVINITVSGTGTDKDMFIDKTGIVKKSGKPQSYKLAVKTSKEVALPSSVSFSITGDSETDGISVSNDGTVSVAAGAKPGCYSIKASAAGYTDAYSELIIN